MASGTKKSKAQMPPHVGGSQRQPVQENENSGKKYRKAGKSEASSGGNGVVLEKVETPPVKLDQAKKIKIREGEKQEDKRVDVLGRIKMLEPLATNLADKMKEEYFAHDSVPELLEGDLFTFFFKKSGDNRGIDGEKFVKLCKKKGITLETLVNKGVIGIINGKCDECFVKEEIDGMLKEASKTDVITPTFSYKAVKQETNPVAILEDLAKQIAEDSDQGKELRALAVQKPKK